MKKCSRCKKSNPDDAKYCLQCGNYLSASNIIEPKKTNRSWMKKIPTLGWIGIGIVALALSLGIIIGGFWALASVEGVASLLFLLSGILVFGVYRKGVFTKIKLIRAIAIGFFALMGASVDQTGNYLYNLPIDKIECPEGTTLNRSVDVINPLPGTTMVSQNFTCYNAKGEGVKTIDSFAVMGYRFVEYILIAYLLIWLRWLINRIRLSRQNT
jgi:hypothetical protein